MVAGFIDWLSSQEGAPASQLWLRPAAAVGYYTRVTHGRHFYGRNCRLSRPPPMFPTRSELRHKQQFKCYESGLMSDSWLTDAR